MEKLSFDFEKGFKYSHKNDFTEHGYNEIHYLFAVEPFLFWVEAINGKVNCVVATHREELGMWGADYGENEINPYDVSDETYAVHVNDTKILNSDFYKEKLQKLVDKVK